MPITAAALVPAAPLLLPALTGGDVPEVAALRSAVRQALGVLGEARPMIVAQALPGTLAGFGSTAVGAWPASGSWPHELAHALLGPAGLAREPSQTDWDAVGLDPLGWVQGLHRSEVATALLLLADGSRTRGPRAPGGDDPRGLSVDAELAAALRAGRVADCPDADSVGATAVPATAVFAALPDGQVQLLHDEAPLGVCYLVATWGPAAFGAQR